MSDSLRPHGLQQSRLPCSPPSPGVCPSSCLLNRWCHPTISSSDALFSFWSFQSFPALGSFPMSQLLASGGQTIGASVSASVFPMISQGWFPLGLIGLISMQSKGLFNSLLQHHNLKASVLQCSAFFMVQLSHSYMTIGKTIALTIQTFVGKVMSLLFNSLYGLDVLFTMSILYCSHSCMKCFLDLSNFLEEISILSHSVVFLYLFALFIEEGYPSTACQTLLLTMMATPFLLRYSWP